MTQTEMLTPAEAFALAMKPMREGAWADAAALWRVFREQYKGHPAPWLQGAISHMRQGQYIHADELLDHARKYFAQHANTWLLSAESARLQGSSAYEELYLIKGREALGSHWELFSHSAAFELRLGRIQQAEAFNAKARELTTERIEPWVQFAEIAEKQGDWEQAKQRWQAVIDQRPEYIRAYSQIANAFKQLGSPVEARRYRLAAQYGPDLLQVPVLAAHADAALQKDKSRLKHFLQLVNTKAVLNLKSESSRTHLNYAWVILEPLLHLIIYYVLFGRLLNAGVENYGLFLLSGLVPWMWFNKAVCTSATSIIGGQSLMVNSNVRPEFFPLVSIVQSTYKQLPALLLLLILGLLTDENSISWSLLYLPLIIAVQFLLTVSIGMLIAAIIPFARDLANLIGTGMTLLMFMSGVIYNFQALPGSIGEWLQYNPLIQLIAAYRDVILHGSIPDFIGLGYVAVFTAGIGLLNMLIYSKQRRNFVRRGMA
ncbi:ABC transporter permease [Pseudomonas helleri]|uniref:Transport permease protein n=1 Tax=Pseudomonas helleri TaxID=1608996 RepID=A0A7X1XLE8_9PSED|nr:ABC transporter permease [Pseudomonas helleri]MQT92206.1 hypothetical protein [Pseudomonas helleri]